MSKIVIIAYLTFCKRLLLQIHLYRNSELEKKQIVYNIFV